MGARPRAQRRKNVANMKNQMQESVSGSASGAAGGSDADGSWRAAMSLWCCCFITVVFFDSLVAPLALLLDFVGTPPFFIVLPAALLDCVTTTRPFISIDQFKKIWLGNKLILNACRLKINTRHFFSAANRSWNATHIPMCVWFSLFPTSLASFLHPSMKLETVDRGRGPTCSQFPRWRPSMKPSIATPVLFDKPIDRGSGPRPSTLLLHVSFELCRSWHFLLLHASLATVVHLEQSSWASYGRDSQDETPSQNVPEPQGRMTHSLHRAHWDDVHWGGSWFAFGRASLPSSPRRGWIARDSGGTARPDVRKRTGVARVVWCPIWRKRHGSSKPTQRPALRA